ncbi:MAG: hypothetical protein ABJE47_10915 [bacterium]
MTYAYTAYGLRLASAFPLPELLPSTPGIADITIRYADVPESLPDTSSHGIAWQCAPGRLLLSVVHVARYLIVGDREIHICPLPDSHESDVRLFLLGSVLGALLHSRRMLVLHASVIETEQGAVLFAGKSGAGKSTLLAAFLQRGYRMLADDKAAIALNGDEVPLAMPGYPLMRLTRSAADALCYPVQASQLRKSLDKYVLPIDAFCATPLPVHAMYSLRAHNRSDIQVERLLAVDTFDVLNGATYRRGFLHEAAQRRAHFQILGAVASRSRVVRIARPAHTWNVDALREHIEEDLRR